tara:strand:+ start:177 stop:1151 length:975 start_codon:yes stop_codon:yes gene_type:complete
MDKSIICPACSGEEFKPIAKNNEFYNSRNILRCLGCGLAFVQPLPSEDEINNFYVQQYSLAHKSYDKKSFLDGLISSFSGIFLSMRLRERFRYLKDKGISVAGKKVLEIGSANGQFLAALRKKGADVVGVEPSRVESENSAKKFNIKPIATNIDCLLPKQEATYDIIFSYHILEHLRDPLKELKNIKHLLKEDGYLIGEVPFTPGNVEALAGVIKKSVFDNLHLFHFNSKSILSLLEKADFSDSKIERLELKSIFKKIYPQANIHYLHPSFEKAGIVKFFSLLQAFELILKSNIGQVTMGPQLIKDLDSEWIGPNDWIRFYARN